MNDYDILKTIEDNKTYRFRIDFTDYDGHGNILKCGLKLGEDIKRLFYFFSANCGNVFRNVCLSYGIEKNSYILYLYFVNNNKKCL